MSKKKTQETEKNPNKIARADQLFADVERDIEEIEKSETIRTGHALSLRLEDMERKVGKLEMLTDITKALNSTLNLNELLEKIIDSTIQLADTDRGFLMLEGESGALEFRIARDRDKRSLAEEDFTISQSIVGDVSRSNSPLFISDILEDDRFKDQKSVLDLQLKRAVCVPLTLEKSVIGVIYTDSNRLSPAFARGDMSIISAFAAQATIAIENAKLHGALVLSEETLARKT